MSSIDQIEHFLNRGLSVTQVKKLIDPSYLPHFLKTKFARDTGFLKNKTTSDKFFKNLKMAYRRRSTRRRATSYRRRSVRARAPRRRRTYRRAQSVPGHKQMTGTGQGDKYLKAFVDPFSDDVTGVKIPDSNAQPSIPLRCLDTLDALTGATNTCAAYAFNATPVAYGVTWAGTTSATSWSWNGLFTGAADSNKLTNIRNDQEMYRPVAHAVRITSGLAPTAATGFVHVCVFSQSLYNQSSWTYPTSIAQMQTVPGYKRIPLGRLTSEGLLVVNRPLDVTAQRYIDSDSPVFASAGTMEFQSGLQWCSVIVAFTGVPISTTIATIENVLHVECIPRASAISQSTPAAKYNTSALGAAANAASKAKAAVLDSEKPERAVQVLNAGLEGAQAAAGKSTIGKQFMQAFGHLRRPSLNGGGGDGIRNSAPSFTGML